MSLNMVPCFTTLATILAYAIATETSSSPITATATTTAPSFTVPPAPFPPYDSKNKTKLHIGALVPFLLTRDKLMFHAAMHTAVRLINNDTNMLKNYELVLDYRDSTTLIGFSYLMFYDLVEKGPIKQMLIGPAFARATRAVAELTTRFKLPQVTYATLQKFGAREVPDPEIQQIGVPRVERHFPFLVKATPSLSSFNEAIVKIFQNFKWKRVAILYEYSAQQFFSTAYDLSLRLKSAGIEAAVIQGFSGTILTVDAQLDAILEKDVRIIFGIFSSKGARRIFCQAYKRGIYGLKYQWLTVSTLKSTWWKPVTYNEPQNCTVKQYLTASDGYMSIANTNVRRDGVRSIGGQTAEEIWDLMKRQKAHDYFRYMKEAGLSNEPPPIDNEIKEESAFAFDAVYLAAITLDKIIKTKGKGALMTEYFNESQALYMTDVMLNSSFEGLTGRLHYGGKSGEERQGIVRIQQFRSNYTQVTHNISISRAELHDIGHFDIESKVIDIYDKTGMTLFKGGRVIKDRKTINRIPETYSLTTIGILWGLAAAGLVLCICVLFINVKYRNIRMIKMSSPNINNGIIAGSIICYASVVVYGLDSRFLTPRGIGIACNAVTIALSIGFTLSFGCLFTKTWRIYKIFTAAKTMEKVSIKDTHLYFIITLLVSIDIFVFLLWVFLSPFNVEESELEQIVYQNADVIDSFFYHKCTCEYQLHFTVTMYCYKGFLLIFGLFLAWETRNVKVAVLNDSKYIGMAVYNVCVVSAVGVICASALYNTQHYTTGYLVVTISIFLCTTGTLLLIFVPKIYLLFGKSFDVTYGNVSVRAFSSSFAGKNMRKGTVSHQPSTSIAENPLELSMYEKQRESDLYAHNRFVKANNAKLQHNNSNTSNMVGVWAQPRMNSC
ncbi:gamma-aminobutyric acid type B receptor subunit 2-like [Clytia hemisphaerica]|uniref:Gamma-aminobutyric acid type B receptor subunit 2 n=1 Tax=Clytia hemisphaerica TaxID=252671 RepID=A0A7M5WJI1_9CNID